MILAGDGKCGIKSPIFRLHFEMRECHSYSCLPHHIMIYRRKLLGTYLAKASATKLAIFVTDIRKNERPPTFLQDLRSNKEARSAFQEKEVASPIPKKPVILSGARAGRIRPRRYLFRDKIAESTLRESPYEGSLLLRLISWSSLAWKSQGCGSLGVACHGI